MNKILPTIVAFFSSQINALKERIFISFLNVENLVLYQRHSVRDERLFCKKSFYTFLILVLLHTSGFGQCTTYPGGTPIATYTNCIDNSNSFTTSSLKAGQYVTLNVIKGYNYTFSVGNAFTGAGENETITIFDAATNTYISGAYGTGLNGASFSWTSTISGQIKIVLSKGACLNDASNGGALTLTLNSIGNTQDSQTSAGTNTWIGHIYNWTGGAPPGSTTSPATPTATNPFDPTQYAGYYNVGSEAINEGFGGDTNCFNVLSNGVQRASIHTQQFAVRYRMNSTAAVRPAGCYLATINGDDGVRLYVDGVLVFDRWVEQSPTSYGNLLIYLTGNSNLVLDYYENGGGNVVNFNLTPFDNSTNTATAPTPNVLCSGVTPGYINGSAYTYNGGTTNPTIKYQWQSAPDVAGIPGTWTNVSTGTGQTLQNYRPVAISGNTLTNITWYRRNVTAAATNASACSYDSNAVSITTNPSFTSGTIQNTGETICYGGTPASTIGNTTGASGGDGVISYSWRTSADSYATAIVGATSSTYTPPAGLIANTSYRRYAKDNTCNTTPIVSTGTWTVTVRPQFATGTIPSTGQTICYAGTPSNIGSTTAATGGDGSFTYSWRSSADSYTTAIVGATSSTYTPPAGLIATTSYQRYVKDGTCNTTPSVSSGTWTVTVRPQFSSGTIANTGETICNNTIPITLIGSTTDSSGGDGNITYQWQYSTSSTFASGVTTVSSNSATYTPTQTLTQTTYYRRQAKEGTCNTTYISSTNVWAVTVNAAVTAGAIGTAQTICNGATPVGFTSTTNGTGSGTISYEWQTNASGSYVTIPSATVSTYSPPALTSTTSYQRRTVSLSGGTTCYSAYTTPITITVTAVLANNNVTYTNGTSGQANASVPEHGTAVLNAPSGTYFDTVNFASYGNPTGSSPNFFIGSCNSISSLSVTEGLVLGNSTASILAENGPFGDPCSGTFKSYSVLVSYAQPLCNGGTTTIAGSTPTGGTGTYTYQWQSSTTSATAGFANAAGTSTGINYASAALTQTTWFRRIAYSCSLNNTSTVVMVKVNALFTSGTIANVGETICYAGTPGVIGNTTNASGGDNNITYSWRSSADGYATAIAGATSSNYTPTSGIIATTSYRRYANDGTCNTTPTVSTGTWTVTVNANNTASAPSSTPSLCINTALLAITHTTTGATGIGTATGLPAGVTASFASNTITLSGTPSVSGTFNYTVPLTGGCGTLNATGTITVTALPAAPTATATAQPSCGLSTGTITVTAPAGMNYSVDGTDYTNTTGIFTGLAAGSYTVTAKNGSGCISLPTAPILINGLTANTWDGSKWSKTGDTTPPTINDIVVFDGDYSLAGDIKGCSCTVNPGKKVTIQAGYVITITNSVNVDTAVGTELTFENNASLVQINDLAVNTGNIVYKRNSQPMNNFDFTYWGSPVNGSQTLHDLSPNTFYDKYWKFESDKWATIMNGAGVMETARGYAIRVPKPLGFPGYPNGEIVPTTAYTQQLSFIGVPNNGVLNLPLQAAGSYNLIGNPYPSALDADEFITENSLSNNRLDGTIYLWTHNTPIANKAYAGISDYAAYNISGGIAATSGGLAPTKNIGSGQAFFMSSTGSGNAVFNNSMRVATANSNGQFYRGTKSKTTVTNKSRVWLNLTNSDGLFKQMLVGYIDGATNGRDNGYDGESFDSNKYVDFYSVNNAQNFTIQGRSVPFVTTDEVPLGYKTTIEGTFAITLNEADGVLKNRSIFVEDKATKTIHNLKNGPYSFTTVKGTFNDRFVLIYVDKSIVVPPVVIEPPVVEPPVVVVPPVVVTPPTEEPPVVVSPPVVVEPPVIVTLPTEEPPVVVVDPTLESPEIVITGRPLVVSVNNHQIKINSFDEIIANVMVYDLRGRLLYEKSDINTNEFMIQDLKSSDQFLIVITQLVNGKWVTKEIVFKN